MDFYLDIMHQKDDMWSDGTYRYHEWTPETIRRFWALWTTNPILRTQFYRMEYWYDLIMWANSMVRQLTVESIMDVGCGSGNVIACVDRLLPGRSIIGIDLSEDALQSARHRFSHSSHISFRVGSIANLPVDDEAVDLVICTEVLEHLFPDEFSKSFREIHRVLRPGGYYLASFPVEEKLHLVACPECSTVFTPFQHMIFYITRDEIRSLLITSGFGLVGFYMPLDRSRPNSRWKDVLKNRILIRWFPRLAYRLWPKPGVNGVLAQKM